MPVSYRYEDILKDQEQFLKHKANNEVIYNKIKLFQETNNLTPNDFVIGGSSCANYMNYFSVKHLRDIDIFVNNTDKKDLEKTSRIDLIRICFCANGYQDRVIEKDGFFFLSPMDLLIQETAGALIKNKLNNIEYVGRMMEYLKITDDEYIPTLVKAVNNSECLGEKWRKTILDNLYLLKKWHSY